MKRIVVCIALCLAAVAAVADIRIPDRDVRDGWAPPVSRGAAPDAQPVTGADTSRKLARPILGSEKTPGKRDFTEFMITLCAGAGDVSFNPRGGKGDAGGIATSDANVATARRAGTDGEIRITAKAVGDATITFVVNRTAGGASPTYTIGVHVVACGGRPAGRAPGGGVRLPPTRDSN